MTTAEALAYLIADDPGARVPCSRYGRDTESCAPVAVQLAEYVADATGEPVTADALDHAMGLVVNDHDDVAELLGPDVIDD